jgi:hypothetical protein
MIKMMLWLLLLLIRSVMLYSWAILLGNVERVARAMALGIAWAKRRRLSELWMLRWRAARLLSWLSRGHRICWGAAFSRHCAVVVTCVLGRGLRFGRRGKAEQYVVVMLQEGYASVVHLSRDDFNE